MRLALVVVALAACGAKSGDFGDDDDAIDPRCDAGDCGFDPPGPPCSAVIGDLSQPIEIVPLSGVRDRDDTLELVDGADMPLIPPFQGGYILLAGGKVRNIDGCHTDVTASLRDPASGQVVGLEQRPSLLQLGDDGWGHPLGAIQYAIANVAVCPDVGSDRDIYDVPWQLEVRYETPDGRNATAIRTIIPRCDPIDLDCPCQCDADFSGGCAAPAD